MHTRLLLAALLATTTVAAAATTASAFDRPPVPLNGLVADGWGQSTTKAETYLRTRYPGIRGDFCLGVTIPGDAADSSWVIGYTRFWDKLLCFGTTQSRAVFGVVYDAKGKYSWVIYRLKGATIRDLQG